MSHACHRFLEMLQNPHVFSLLTRCTIPCACHRKGRFNVQKWREHVVLCTFWLRNVLCATTAYGVFRLFLAFSLSNVLLAAMPCAFSTSQLLNVLRSPEAEVFCAFDFQMCFAPQQRALFRDHNFQLPKVVRCWCVLCILTWKCASRHDGVQLYNFHLSSDHIGSAPAALASLLFDLSEPQIIGNTQCFATFLPFRAPAPYFFWLFLLLFSFLLSSSLLFSSSSSFSFSSLLSSLSLLFSSLLIPAFHLPIVSEVWLLNFLWLWPSEQHQKLPWRDLVFGLIWGTPRESKTSTRESSAKGVRQGRAAKAAAKASRK